MVSIIGFQPVDPGSNPGGRISLKEIKKKKIKMKTLKNRLSDAEVGRLKTPEKQIRGYGQNSDNSSEIPLPCQICQRKEKYLECKDLNNCSHIDGDHGYSGK